jgi:hypothetical protein
MQGTTLRSSRSYELSGEINARGPRMNHSYTELARAAILAAVERHAVW